MQLADQTDQILGLQILLLTEERQEQTALDQLLVQIRIAAQERTVLTSVQQEELTILDQQHLQEVQDQLQEVVLLALDQIELMHQANLLVDQLQEVQTEAINQVDLLADLQVEAIHRVDLLAEVAQHLQEVLLAEVAQVEVLQEETKKKLRMGL